MYLKLLISLIVILTFASTSYVFAEQPPVIITQVELWGPVSFHVENIKYCIPGATYLGPWSVGWVELYNTQNKTITLSNVVLKGSSWDSGFEPITMEPHQYCYLQTQDKFSTRVGPGGSLGNDPPPHNDVTITLKYSEQKIPYLFSTISLTDNYEDTRTWHLINSEWLFDEANIKFVPSPLKQFNSGITIDKIQCKEGMILISKHDDTPACVKPDSKLKLIEYGWAKSFS